MAEQTLVLQIEGMTCEDCSQSIQDALRQERGVRDVQVDWCCGTGVIVFDDGQTNQGQIVSSAAFQGEYRARVAGGGCC